MNEYLGIQYQEKTQSRASPLASMVFDNFFFTINKLATVLQIKLNLKSSLKKRNLQ
jgi:hypothetical protein